MNPTGPAYGLWTLVIINSAVFIIFLYSFAKPRTARDWRSFGALSAFLVALFTEMYGFPLTIYLLSGWLQTRHPQYAAFVLIMLGFLVQWPTLLTLLMFPVLVGMYARLALREEREMETNFGDDYRHYAADTPRFFPRRRTWAQEA